MRQVIGAIVGKELAVSEMDLPRAKSHRQVPMAVRRLLARRAEAIGAAATETPAAA